MTKPSESREPTILQVCCLCGKVRHRGRWVSPAEHPAWGAESPLSHGLCPQCIRKQYGDFFDDQA